MNISVLIPVFNSDRFLAEAIDSVLGQTFRNFELIVIDDGSTDRSPQILANYAAKDSRVKIITHANIGMGQSLNKAMSLANGDWIARLDGDDIMEPDRLERQIDFLQKNPDVVVASSLVYYLDDNSRIIGKNTSKFTNREAVKAYVAKDLPIGFHHPAAIFRKDIILSLGGYRSQFWPADDMDLWNRVVDAGHQVLVQEEYLTRYRIHASSVMVGKFRSADAKANWVEACILARHQNRLEPTWDEFNQQRAKMPWSNRFNSSRRGYARALYKAATLHFSHKKYLKFAPGLLAALLLEPWYVLPRVLPQLRKS